MKDTTDYRESMVGPWYEKKPSKFKKFLNSYWRWIVISIAFCVVFFEGDYYRQKLWPKKEIRSFAEGRASFGYFGPETIGCEAGITITSEGTATDAIMITSSAGGIDMTDGDISFEVKE